MPIQFAGTNQFPETTEVIQYNILEIDKDGDCLLYTSIDGSVAEREQKNQFPS